MVVNVVIQSDLSAPANGYLQVSVDEGQPVAILVAKFCEEKNLEQSSQYCLVDSHNRVLNLRKPISHYGIQNGDKVLFCSSSEKASQYQSWNFIAITAVIFSIIGFIICLAIFLGFVVIPDNYALVVDAGSTHSEILLYRWPGLKINNTGIVVQAISCDVKGGVGELTSAADVPGYFGDCLRKIKASIPSESTDHTQIFFGATAGMRILEETNPTLAKEILDETRNTLSTAGLKFAGKDAKILTGSEEGASGWLTVNYLNSMLLQKRETWGALDLGGASTQISFQLNDTEPHPKNESLVANFQVYGRKVNVFSKSYLCYGLYQSELRYRAHLILNSQGRIVASPCEHSGFSLDYPASQIFKSSCTPIPADKELLQGKFTFTGTSNVEECHSTMKYLLSEEFCQRYQLADCLSVGEIPEGFQKHKYLGFSAFGHVNRSLNLNASATRQQFEEAIKKECGMSLQGLFSEYIREDKEIKGKPKDLQLACFKRYYVFTLLSDIYEFNTDERWSNLHFGLKVNDKNLGWALGFMVNGTQSIAAAPSQYGMSTLVFVLLVVLFSIFLLISILFVVHVIKSKKSLNRSYRSLNLVA